MPMERRAEEIAATLLDCKTEYRGDLLIKVAEILRFNAQGFTAGVIEAAGKAYNGDLTCPRT